MRFVSAVAAQLLLLLAGQAAVQPAPASEVGHTLSGIVSDLPPEVEPGETIQLQVLDETKLPPGGTFSLAGVVVDTDPPPEGQAVALTPPADPAARPGPESLGALAAVLASENDACGRAWEGITVDGRRAYPSTASLRTVLLPTSTTTATGPHEVAGAVAAGYPSTSHAQFTVVTIGGKIDASVLRKGGTTEIELWVSGTTDPMELRVQNLSPSIIRVDGGNDQRIVTSGGTPNRLSRRVTGIVAGAFNINYVLAEDRCPCAPKSGRPAPASGR